MLFKKKQGYTFEEIEKYEHIFYIKYLVNGMTVFDVGANIGELSMVFSKYTGNTGIVHSFEPTPGTFNKLESIIKLANLKNITINQLAVSKTEGFIDFNIYCDEFSKWNTSAHRPLEKYGIYQNPENCIKIDATTIDSYCIKNKINKIDLLKIDVERC